MIAAGTIGRILHMEANVSHDLFARMEAGNWRVSAQDAPAGPMTALGVHLTDLFISFAGRPRTVRARTARILPDTVGVDHVSAWLEFASGVTGAITCLSATPFHGRLTVFGTDGWVEVKENANVDKRFDGDGVTFITTTEFGQKIESTFGKRGNQIVQLTFTIVKIPIPNDPVFIAVVTKASLVNSNGSIGETIGV